MRKQSSLEVDSEWCQPQVEQDSLLFHIASQGSVDARSIASAYNASNTTELPFAEECYAYLLLFNAIAGNCERFLRADGAVPRRS